MGIKLKTESEEYKMSVMVVNFIYAMPIFYIMYSLACKNQIDYDNLYTISNLNSLIVLTVSIIIVMLFGIRTIIYIMNQARQESMIANGECVEAVIKATSITNTSRYINIICEYKDDKVYYKFKGGKFRRDPRSLVGSTCKVYFNKNNPKDYIIDVIELKDKLRDMQV